MSAVPRPVAVAAGPLPFLVTGTALAEDKAGLAGRLPDTVDVFRDRYDLPEGTAAIALPEWTLARLAMEALE